MEKQAPHLSGALSIAVGVFAVGLVVSSFVIVKQNMERDYQAINPHTFQIFCQDFDQDMLHGLANTPGVTAIEARYNLWIKIAGSDGKEYPINLNSIGPLEEMQVDKLVFQQGATTLGYREIYLERQGAEGLGVNPGDYVDLILSTGKIRTLKVAGTVHDVIANPFKFTSSTAGFVMPKTMEWLGDSASSISLLSPPPVRRLMCPTFAPSPRKSRIRSNALGIASSISVSTIPASIQPSLSSILCRC